MILNLNILSFNCHLFNNLENKSLNQCEKTKQKSDWINVTMQGKYIYILNSPWWHFLKLMLHLNRIFHVCSCLPYLTLLFLTIHLKHFSQLVTSCVGQQPDAFLSTSIATIIDILSFCKHYLQT